MKHFSENEYDDDLTLGTDDQDESYYADAVDLFEITSDIEAPISRLKSLILSIDWEITDEVLLQFSEELQDLKDIWAAEKINLVYLQALEKICRYIYQKKADAHPHAIKLLLNLYHNLERIVSSDELSEEAKKEILLDDIKRFENLKRAISNRQEEENSRATAQPAAEPAATLPPLTVAAVDKKELLPLKAIVLGIDWEITDKELNNLREEVVRLEEEFVGNRPASILLQGIGSLAAYIKAKKSNAHADAFGVLHFFYESLERLAREAKTLEAGKAILFPAVERFNAFKALIGPTIASEEQEPEEEIEEEAPAALSGVVVPALADVPLEVQQGFQAEVEAQSLGIASPDGILAKVEDFFGGEPVALAGDDALSPGAADSPGDMDSSVARVTEAFFGQDLKEAEESFSTEVPVVDRDRALQGVDVESDADDDSEEAELPMFGDEPAPALVESDQLPPVAVEAIAGIDLEEEDVDGEITSTLDGFFGEEPAAPGKPELTGLVGDMPAVDRETALQGVVVESNADDEGLALLMGGDEPAPALAEGDAPGVFDTETVAGAAVADDALAELDGTLDGFFGTEKSAEQAVVFDHAGGLPVLDRETALQGVEVETDGDDDSAEPVLPMVGDEPAPALGEMEEVTSSFAVSVVDSREADEIDLEEVPAPVADFWGAEEVSIEPGREEEAAAREALVDQEEFTPALFGDEQVVTDALSADQESGGIEDALVLDEHLDTLFVEEDTAAVPSFPAGGMDQREIGGEPGPDDEEDVIFLPVDEFDEVVEDSADRGEQEYSALGEVPHQEQGLGPDQEGQPSFSEEVVGPVEEEPGPLAALQGCIHLLAVDQKNSSTATLFREINSLRQKRTTGTLEKTFLQLLSTVAQHVERHGPDVDYQAQKLMKSVGEALARAVNEPARGQDLLLMETLKVLEWQQGIISRQASVKTAILREGSGHHQGNVPGAEAFDRLLARTEAVEMRMAGGDQQPDGDAGRATTLYPEEIRREIEALRRTLQEEIAGLRRALKDDTR